MVGKHPLGSFYRLRYLNLQHISLLLIGPNIFFNSNFFFLGKKGQGREGATNCVCHFFLFFFCFRIFFYLKENSFCCSDDDIIIYVGLEIVNTIL